MNKRFSLQTLLDLSQLRLDDAARQLGKLMVSEREATQRLQLLEHYRAEYHNRFMATAKDGLGRDQWRNFEAFLGRLDQAIAQAQIDTQRSQQNTAVGKQAWIDKRGQVNAYDTLAQRHQARLQAIEQKREQKIQDEHAARSPQGDDAF